MSFGAEEEFATVESVKSFSEVYLPFAAKVAAVNEDLEDEPELVNEDAQGKGWFVEVEAEEEIDTSDLLTEDNTDDYWVANQPKVV